MALIASAASRRPLFAFPNTLNEPVVRTVAAGVVGGIALGWALDFPWIVPVLALGFALRVAAGPRFSLLAQTAIRVVRRAGFRKKIIPGAPKQFAAAIGATLLGASTALHLLGLAGAGWAVAALVAFFASLEAAFAFCLGCKIYALIFPCPECAVAAALGDKPDAAPLP